MTRILVTGAAGFIGSHTVDVLLEQGHTVAGVDNLRTGRLETLMAARSNPAFSFFQHDLMESGCCSALMRSFRPEAVIHLAALVSVPESIANPALNRHLNFDLSALVATAALDAGVKRFVFASSAAVYGTCPLLPLTESAPCVPVSPYGQAKLDSEAWLLAQTRARPDFVVRCQRYFNVYGPRQDPSSSYSGVISRFADALKHGREPVIFGDGEQTRDFVSVFDVARANALAALRPDVETGVANICTGRAVSLNTLCSVIGGLSEAPRAVRYEPARAGDIRHSSGSPERARRDFGFAAQVELPEGLKRLLASVSPGIS